MHHDWTKLAAKAIPKEGFLEEEQGRYGPIFPRTPACYGFTIIAKIKPGTEQTIRGYGKKIEETIAGLPDRGLHEAGRDPGSLHRHPPSDPITILRLM